VIWMDQQGIGATRDGPPTGGRQPPSEVLQTANQSMPVRRVIKIVRTPRSELVHENSVNEERRSRRVVRRDPTKVEARARIPGAIARNKIYYHHVHFIGCNFQRRRKAQKSAHLFE